MLTCKSPRKVMRVAYQLARQVLPEYSHKFSRHDFTLPQLFACLAAKERLKCSYRGIEAVLKDSEGWLKDIGLSHAPDHNTLCRAQKILLTQHRINRYLDQMAQWAAVTRILGLSKAPLAIDSTYFESHHVSRHYERRCLSSRQWLRRKEKAKTGRNSTRSDTVKAMPKLGLAVASGCHLVLSLWTGTGMGADQPLFKPLLSSTRQRVRNKHLKVVADAGLDSMANHELAREQLGVQSLMPATHGRPRKDGGPAGGKWRRHCQRLLSTPRGRKRCGYTQRWQAETANSMMKRNQGSALSGKTAWSRKRDMALKVLTHNVMILEKRVETEQ